MSGQPEDDTHTIDQWHNHTAAIADAVARWRQGEITVHQKRKAIADENYRYYGAPRKSPVTGEMLTAVPRLPSIADVLATVTGVPVDAMRAALHARAEASVLAQQALDDGATSEAGRLIAADGVTAYADIIRTARKESP